MAAKTQEMCWNGPDDELQLHPVPASIEAVGTRGRKRRGGAALRALLVLHAFLAPAVLGCGGDGAKGNPSDEAAAAQDLTVTVTVTVTPGNFGDPLAGTDPGVFADAREEFGTAEEVDDGMGPLFNGPLSNGVQAISCASCHSVPVTGGGSAVLERRVGRLVPGGLTTSLVHDHAIVNGNCNAQTETFSNLTADTKRMTTPLFGAGLVDAVDDATFLALETAESTTTTPGHANIVQNRVTGGTSVGKFGWKSQVPSLAQFSADAYRNEMGITSPLFPVESCPDGSEAGSCPGLNPDCDPVPGLEDGGADVAQFAEFMTDLGPPPRGAITPDVVAGQAQFNAIGCAACHVATLVTGPNHGSRSNLAFSPYSDFLVHNMGTLGDGIVQGTAQGSEMRTAPLWGLGVRPRFLHDGRTASISAAILAHDGQARTARNAFALLLPLQQQQILAFLNSL